MNSFSIWANNRLRLILTGRCNLNCFYCHNEGQPKSLQFFPEHLFVRVREMLENGKGKLDSVTLSGGEPLLHPSLENFISGVTPFSTSRTVVTNGLLLTADKLSRLKEAGLTKIRLGVDSLRHKKSRPSSGAFPERSIHDVIEVLFEEDVRFELNVVLTPFNVREITELVRFCKANRISAKFFEHVQVHSFGSKLGRGKIESRPLVAFETFDVAVRSVLENATCRVSPDFGEANSLYEADGFTIRYCRYLCPFGLCYKTGTRIEPNGFVYTCLERDGEFRISATEPLANSVCSVLRAKTVGMCVTRSVFQAA